MTDPSPVPTKLIPAPMRTDLRRRRLSGVMGAAGMLFLGVGVFGVVYASVQMATSFIEQKRLQQTFARSLETATGVSTPDRQPGPAVDRPAPVPPVSRAEPGAILGRLEIERLGIEVIVLEGATGEVLRRGAGRIGSTARPGERGNMGIAAHRDTFFGGLGSARPGDTIRFVAADGTGQRYVVESTSIVSPDAVHVLDDVGDTRLTLVTCYPFNVVGAAPDRFIVHARAAFPDAVAYGSVAGSAGSRTE